LSITPRGEAGLRRGCRDDQPPSSHGSPTVTGTTLRVHAFCPIRPRCALEQVRWLDRKSQLKRSGQQALCHGLQAGVAGLAGEHGGIHGSRRHRCPLLGPQSFTIMGAGRRGPAARWNLRAPPGDQERHVWSGLGEAAAEISAGCSGADDQNGHARFHSLWVHRRDRDGPLSAPIELGLYPPTRPSQGYRPVHSEEVAGSIPVPPTQVRVRFRSKD